MTPEMTARTRSTFCGDLTAQDHRNLMRYNLWCLAWALLWVAASMAVKRWGAPLQGLPGWLLAAVTVVPGIVAIRAYFVFLREADELLRKIQLEALALAFGTGALFMMTWRLIERVGGPKLDVSDPVLVMFVVWALAQWLGARRYR